MTEGFQEGKKDVVIQSIVLLVVVGVILLALSLTSTVAVDELADTYNSDRQNHPTHILHRSMFDALIKYPLIIFAVSIGCFAIVTYLLFKFSHKTSIVTYGMYAFFLVFIAWLFTFLSLILYSINPLRRLVSLIHMPLQNGKSKNWFPKQFWWTFEYDCRKNNKKSHTFAYAGTQWLATWITLVFIAFYNEIIKFVEPS